MTLTLDPWMLAVGAIAGAAAVYGARGRSRLVSGAVIGAVVALVLGLLRGML